MVATRNSWQPSALDRRRQNPARNSRSQITQLVDSSSGSDDDLSGDDAAVSDAGAFSDSDIEVDSFAKIDADETPQALALPLRGASRPGEQPRRRSRKTQPRRDEVTPSPASKKRKPAKRKRRAAGPPATDPSKRSKIARQQPEEKELQKVQSGVIPDWRDPRIPFECWEDIFYYAAYGGYQETLTTNWLLLVATTCHHFTEPALSTLYRLPIIKTSAKAKKFAALIEQPPSGTRLNYRAMIEELHLDIHTVPQSLLYQIIHPLPRLKELILLTPFDQAPYRELDRTIRWQYPEDVFKALLPASPEGPATPAKPFPTYLKSWEWSARLVGGYVANSADMGRIHQLPSFGTLSRVSFTNFQVPSLRKREPRNENEELQFLEEDNTEINAIAASIAELKSLQHLVFESSTVMNYHMFPQLPRNLTHLELINCWEVKSEDLTSFLRTGGKNMRFLSLHHNQSLDLSFLTDMAETCPNLRELNMNLVYYRLHESGNDSDPMYEHALLPEQIPKWPRSIRAISIEHIRGWSVETAEMFLQTLLDNAQNLPDLRYISIKTMLDISWKARAIMRRDWGAKMERVFLRRFEPPRDFGTLRPVEQCTAAAATPPPKTKRSLPPTSSSRRSGRIAASSETGTRSGRAKSLRHSGEGHRQSYRDPDTDEDDFDATQSEAESDADERDGGHSSSSSDYADENASNCNEPQKQIIQGLCRTVNILFDNQKVRELQYGMEDFQSDNDDSEDEWDGDYEEDDPVLQF